MAYTAITPPEFRSKKGTISQKLGAEFASIDSQLDIVGQPQAQTVGPLLITGTIAWYVRMPCACTVDSVTSVVGTAVDASTVITASVVAESAAMTGGTQTIGDGVSASVAGYSTTATPTALNTVAADASITVAADGSASSGEAYFTIVYTPTA